MADSDNTSFSYEPLPPNHVRLISLWGIPINTFPEEINCRFEVHHIDNLPEYDAISYAWGNEPATEPIKCLSSIWGEGTMNISHHLWRGLGTIMHKAPSHLCWVDTLSIDQNNVKEKEHQIPLMAKIYGRATNVIVWLGEPDHHWGQGMLSPEMLAIVGILLKTTDPGQMMSMTVISDPTWQAFAAAFRSMQLKPWFRRSWVCQETIMAKEILVLYGQHRIPWDLLYAVSTTMRETNFDTLMMADISDNDLNNVAKRFNSMGGINELRGSHRRDPEHILTDRLIDLIRNTGATKLSDKVYCILGMLAPEIASQITVDYNKPYQEVYLEFARAVVTHDKRLSLLAMPSSITIPGPTGSPPITLPSWCPDLTRHAPDIFSFLDYEYSAGFTNIDHQTNRVTVLPHGNHIVVPGFRLGTIAEIAPLRPDIGVPSPDQLISQASSTLSSIGPWLNTIDALISRALLPLGASPAHILDVTWRTHIADAAYVYLTPDPSDPNNFLTDTLEAFYPASPLLGQGYLAWRQIFPHTDPSSWLTDHHARAHKDLHLGPREMKLFEQWNAAIAGLSQRRIFRTENGLVGTGPKGLQVGDVACVLYDASPVMVLRRIVGTGDAEWKQCFRAVGDAYVYGCMELDKTADVR